MTLRAVTSFALTIGFAAAQCPFSSFSVAVVGSGCNPVVAGAISPITASASFTNCSVQVGLPVLLDSATPIVKVLVLGLTEVHLPVPVLGAGCVLVPSADLFIAQPVLSSPFQLAMPPVISGTFALVAQGAVFYSASASAASYWAVSDALRLTLQ